MLLNSSAVKTNFFQGKPSDEANQLNHGMVKTFMSMSQPITDDKDMDSSNNRHRNFVDNAAEQMLSHQ